MAVLEAVVEWLALADKEANETPYSLFYRRLSPLAMSPVLSPASMSPDNSEPSTPHEEQHGEGQLHHHHHHHQQQQHVESSHGGGGGGGGGGEKGQPTVVDLELSRNVAAAEETADARLRLLRSPQHFTAKFLIGWRRGRRRQSRRRRRQGVLVERASITTGGRLGVGVFLSAGSDRYNKC